jgi:hypothetical protein
VLELIAMFDPAIKLVTPVLQIATLPVFALNDSPDPAAIHVTPVLVTVTSPVAPVRLIPTPALSVLTPPPSVP